MRNSRGAEGACPSDVRHSTPSKANRPCHAGAFVLSPIFRFVTDGGWRAITKERTVYCALVNIRKPARLPCAVLYGKMGADDPSGIISEV